MKIRLTKKNQVLLKPRINRKLHGFKLFMLATVFSIGFSTVNAQNAKVSISQQNISIKDVIQRIEKQTTYLFVYNPSEINLDKKVNVNMTDASVKDVLTSVLKDQQLSFYQEGNNIVLQKLQQQDKGVKKQILGVVKDSNGETLIGASVIVKGEKIGTVTDIDGKYSLSVPVGSAIEVTYMGYVSQTATITSKNNYDFVLIEDSKTLDAVVVTALGIKRSQKALSYNVQEIKQDDITTVKDANFINSLNGKVAGVNINASSSGIGGSSKVVMRGSKSINQSSNALYVIDGVPMYNARSDGGTEFDSKGSSESIADINPEDIESMTVLTGAAAAALYGSEAANGAIIVTTKKGRVGKTTLVVTQNTDFLTPLILPDFQNRYGTGTGGLAPAPGVNSDKSWGQLLNSYNSYGYSPKDNYLKTGVVTTETISLSTGSENNQTYLSAGAVNSDGLVPNNNYDRYNFTFRNTTNFLNDKFVLDLGGSYIKQTDLNMTNQGIYMNPLVPAYLFPRGEDWSYVEMYEQYNSSRKISTQNRYPGLLTEWATDNPYWINHRTLRKNKKDRYMLNASLKYDILDWLNVVGRVRIDNANTDYSEKLFATTNTTITQGSNNGFFGIRDIKDRQTYADVMVNINKSLTEDLTLVANAGAIYSDMRQDMTEIGGPLVDTDIQSAIPNKFEIVQLDKAKAKYYQDGFREQTQSLFASVELGYKGAYYLTLTGRNDWPSQLAGVKSTKSSFFYPSVGTSFVLSEIFNIPRQIEYLKVRASFASVGTAFSRNLASMTGNNHVWDGNRYDPAMVYPVSNLKPENTQSWEVGLTAKFLKGFNFDLTLYNTETRNQTFDPKISPSSGYTNFIIQTGNVQNRGIELSFGYNNKWGDFSWATNYTFSANKNKILKLAENWVNPQDGSVTSIDELEMRGLGNSVYILKVGGTLGDMYALTELKKDHNNDIYIDKNGDVTAQNVAEPIKLGSVFPKSNMAWRNEFTWNNFNLGFLVTARLGGVVYSATQAVLDRYGVSEESALARDRGGVFVNGGDVVDPEKWYSTIGASVGMPQYYTYSATNVRLQEASLGYTFTKDKLWGIGEATITLIGRNLFMLYHKAPFDPESVATTGNFYHGIDYFMMPSTRNLGFSVRLKF